MIDKKINFIGITLISVILIYGCATVSNHDYIGNPEGKENLGFGFMLVRSSSTISGNNSFEAVTHGASIYFDGKYVGSAGTYSISPSGKYLLFLDYDSNGRVMLFKASNSKITALTSKSIGVPEEFFWNEKDMSVKFIFFDGKPPVYLSL